MDRNQIKHNQMFLYITYAIVLAFVLFNYKVVLSALSYVLSLATPFYIAILLAFLLNIPMDHIEKRLSKNIKKKKLLRGLSLTLTCICVIIVIILFASFIVPKLVESIQILITNIIGYTTSLINMINKLFNQLNINYSFNHMTISEAIRNLNLVRFLPGSGDLSEAGLDILISSVGVFNFFFNLITSIVMSLYILMNKEAHLRQLRKVITYFFGYKKALNFFDITYEATHYFNGFVSGQLTEAVILTLLMYIGFWIFKMPFAELFAVVIGILSIIPLFGGYIGYAICGFLVLAVEPSKFITFTILFLGIQQFEGNVIYPRVVGNAVGISGLYVLLSLVIFGNLWGFFGMLIAVPSMALIYAVSSRVITIGLYRRNIEVTSSSIKKMK